MRAFLKKIYFSIFRIKQLDSLKNYNFTDEKLKFVHILEAINMIRIAQLNRVYYEFGVHSGRTFSAAVNASNFFKLYDMEFFAFDSFRGLPETSESIDGVFKEGEFNTPISEWKKVIKKKTGLRLSEQNIISGFYESSLKDPSLKKIPKAGVIHIDVDLYSSTCEVLDFVKDKMTIGTIILFDDWYCFNPGQIGGEKKAFIEFKSNNTNFKFEEWKNYSTFGKSFFVTGIE